MKTLPDIIAKLPTLSYSELKELQSRVAGLLSLMKAGTSEAAKVEHRGDDIDFVLEVIHDVLHHKGIEVLPATVLRRGIKKDFGFDEKAAAICLFLRKASRSKVGRRSLLKTGVELLFEHHRFYKLPVDAVSLMKNLDHIPRVLDDAFPGYAESGVLEKINQLRKPPSRQEVH